MGSLTKFLALIVIASSLAMGAEAAECLGIGDLPATPTPLDVATGRTSTDRVGRMVAPVMINGQGPYRFIVDTGANRSVLSLDLAAELGLAAIGTGEVHSVHGITVAPIVEVNSLRYGPLTLPSQPLPLLQGPMLAGQQGLLGVDGMAGRRLHLDFVRRCIEIVASASANRLGSGWTTVRGQMRFGHLVVLRGAIRSVAINVLIDTGSDTSLANVALREALRARARSQPSALAFARAYSAGEPVILDDAVALPELQLGELSISDLLVYVGNFHIFELWQMQDEPTLLIGMDVLRRTRAIAIDYERGTVHFRLHGAPRAIHYAYMNQIRVR